MVNTRLATRRGAKRASSSASRDLKKKLNVSSINGLKITDLNSDCLFHLFKMLPLTVVLKLAKLAIEFIEPTKMIIRQTDVTFSYCYDFKLWNVDPMVFSGYAMIPELWLWKHLGPVIKKLNIDFKYIGEMSTYIIEDYILDYCTAVEVMELKNCRDYAFENIKMPFDKLETFVMINGTLGPTFGELSKWAPKLRNLTLNCKIWKETMIEDCLAKPFPNMEAMSIKLSTKWPGRAKNFLTAYEDARRAERIPPWEEPRPTYSQMSKLSRQMEWRQRTIQKELLLVRTVNRILHVNSHVPYVRFATPTAEHERVTRAGGLGHSFSTLPESKTMSN